MHTPCTQLIIIYWKISRGTNLHLFGDQMGALERVCANKILLCKHFDTWESVGPSTLPECGQTATLQGSKLIYRCLSHKVSTLSHSQEDNASSEQQVQCSKQSTFTEILISAVKSTFSHSDHHKSIKELLWISFLKICFSHA